MAFTVCAEEYPLTGGVDASYGIPGNEGYITAEESEAEEPEILRGGEISYGNATNHTVTDFFRFMMNNFWNNTAVTLPVYSLGEDLELDDVDWKNLSFWEGTSHFTQDDNYTKYPINSGNKIEINGNGHRIRGRKGNESAHNTNLDMFSYVHISLEFRNIVFEDFNNSAICYNNISPCPGRTIILNNCTFIDNSGEYGGAVRADEGVKLLIENCTFINNTATKHGGAVAVLHENSTLGISGCRFQENVAAEKGGAVYNNATAYTNPATPSYYNNSKINKTIFLNNSAENGGAIFKERFDRSWKDEIHYCIFLNNSATEMDAGAMTGEPNSKGDAGFVNLNWFGNTEDNADRAPNIGSVIPTAGTYNWACLRLRKKLLNDRYTFTTDLNNTRYSNGTNGTTGYDEFQTFPDFTMNVSAPALILERPDVTMSFNAGCYEGVFYGTLMAPGTADFEVTLTDPLGNVLYGESQERGNIGAQLVMTGRDGIYHDYEEYSSIINDGDDLIFLIKEGTSALANEQVQFSVNGGEPIEGMTNVTGHALLGGGNITAPGNVIITITSPVLKGEFEKEYYISPLITASMDLSNYGNNMTYGDDVSLMITAYYEYGLEGGTFSVAYETDTESDILKSWRIANGSLEDPAELNTSIRLNTLGSGNYTFYAGYTPEGGTDTIWSAPSENISILQRKVGIEWEEKDSFVYDENLLQAPAASATGLVNTDVIKVGISGVNSDVGKYTAHAFNLNGTKAHCYFFDNSAPECYKDYEIVKAAGLSFNKSYNVTVNEGGEAVWTMDDLSALMPAKAGNVSFTKAGEPDITGNMVISDLSVEGVKAVCTIKNAGAGDSVILPLKAGSHNYNDSYINIRLDMTADTVSDETVTVGGDTVGGVTVHAGTKVETLPVDLGTGSAGEVLNLTVVYTQNVTFTANKFKVKEMEDLGNGTYRLGGVVINVNSTLTEVAKPNFKFKNTKYASDNPKCKKQPCFIISFKANSGISKENKTDIKTANKALKKKPVEFRIEQADLSMADVNDSKVFMNPKRDKVKKAEISLSGNKLTLKKKDYDAVIAEKDVNLTGKGDYKGNLTLPLPG